MNACLRPALVLAAAAATVGVSVSVAHAAPPVPAGCTFDRATGVSTCTTTSKSAALGAADTLLGSTSDATPMALFCLAEAPGSTTYSTNAGFLEVSAFYVKTVTTSYQGVSPSSGKKPSATSAKTLVTVSIGYDSGNGLKCDATTFAEGTTITITQ